MFTKNMLLLWLIPIGFFSKNNEMVWIKRGKFKTTDPQNSTIIHTEIKNILVDKDLFLVLF